MGKTELFIELLTRHQHRILLFILSLVRNQTDAEEILQETSLVLWQKFDEFEPGTSFKAWAFRVAYLKVRKHWDRRNHDGLRFDQEFLERVAAIAGSASDTADRQEEALARCLERLPEKDRDLVRFRYQRDGSVKTAAKRLGRSKQAVYQALARIRQRLHDCVRMTLAVEHRV
jgi:RNA polymerase sigma-70 factor (ECF subfamily)